MKRRWRENLLTAEDEAKPFLDHLEDLRRMLFRVLGSLVIGMLIAIPFTPTILDLLKYPLEGLVDDPDQFLRSMQVAGAFSSIMRMSFWSGLLFSIPFIVFFVGQFVFPGLTQLERKAALTASISSFVLFVIGVALGYFITLRVAIGVMMKLHGWIGIQAEWTVTSYVAFTTHLLIGFGLAFQLPVLVMALGKLGLVDSRQLRDHRRHVFIGLLVMAMFLTPPDVITQLIMAAPLFILYEGCIWLLWSAERKRAET